MTGAPPKPSDCQKPLPGAPVIGFSDLLGGTSWVWRAALRISRNILRQWNCTDETRLEELTKAIAADITAELEKENMNGRQIYALRMAANIIKQLDMDLSKLGKGRNLSNVPGFEGQDFASALIGMATNAEKLNAPEPEDTQTLSRVPGAPGLTSEANAAPLPPNNQAERLPAKKL